MRAKPPGAVEVVQLEDVTAVVLGEGLAEAGEREKVGIAIQMVGWG